MSEEQNACFENFKCLLCSAMHPFRPTKPMIRICGIVGRNGCIALQPSENDAVQPVKAGMKGIGIGLWTHYILLRTTFRCPLVYEKKQLKT